MSGGGIRIYIGCSEDYATCDPATMKCTGGDGPIEIKKSGSTLTITHDGSTAYLDADQFKQNGVYKEIAIFPRPGQAAAVLGSLSNWSFNANECEGYKERIYLTPGIKTTPSTLVEIEESNDIGIKLAFKKLNSDGDSFVGQPEIIDYVGTYELRRDDEGYLLSLDVSQKKGSQHSKYPLKINETIRLKEEEVKPLKLTFFANPMLEGEQKVFLLNKYSGGSFETVLIKFLENSPFADPVATSVELMSRWGVSRLEVLKRMAVIKWKQMIMKDRGNLPVNINSCINYEDFAAALGLKNDAKTDEITDRVKNLGSAKPKTSIPDEEKDLVAFLKNEPLANLFSNLEVTIKGIEEKLKVDRLKAIKYLAVIKWKQMIMKKLGLLPDEYKTALTYEDFAKALGLTPDGSIEDITNRIDHMETSKK